MSDPNHDREKDTLTTRYADLLNEQSDAAELQLLHDLEIVYTSTRVPAQLIAEGLQGLEEPGRPQESPVQYFTRQPVMPNRGVATMQRRRWVKRLNALAAVLVAAALVGSLLVVMQMAQRSQQENDKGQLAASQCVHPQAKKSSAWLSSLHMINATTGWALGVDHSSPVETNHILRTTDGGRVWQDVTPVQSNAGTAATPSKIAYAGEPLFLNACSAWVAVGQPRDAPALLFRTNDGGQTWRQSTLPGNAISGIDFINSRMGWLRLNGFNDSTLTLENIYQSRDGGQTWQRIAHNAFPVANADSHLTFINASTGWMTGALSVHNTGRLYVTHDGGQTWTEQLWSIPRDKSGRFATGAVVWPPQFFSANDGILPVSFWSDNGLDVYVTHDGGRTWHSTTLLPVPGSPNLDLAAPTPAATFVDVNHGWVSDWTGAHLYMTNDGGKHWTALVPHINMNYIALYGYDFVTSKVGWALGAITHKTIAPLAPRLFKTEDGGRTWTQVQKG